jgi:hypothetical protein
MVYNYIIEHLHSYRIFNIAIFNIAIFNILATIFAGYLISYFYKKSFFYTCIFLFMIKYYFINIINSLKILLNIYS